VDWARHGHQGTRTEKRYAWISLDRWRPLLDRTLAPARARYGGDPAFGFLYAVYVSMVIVPGSWYVGTASAAPNFAPFQYRQAGL